MTKNHLRLAVAAAVGAGFSASPALASHFSEQLFPYVVKDTNRTTVVTIIADGATDGGRIHLQYWTKSTTAANTAACQPSSVFVPMTDDDIMTFDTAGLLGYPLFGDTTNPAPLGAAISYAAPRHGYLLALQTNGNNDLKAGYWIELDLANGGAHGDSSVRGNGNETNDGGGLLYGELESYGITGITGQNSLEPWHPRAVNFWPTSVASTVFTVTPLGSEMATNDNNQTVLQVFNSNFVQGAYDRNENGVDGTVPITVRCVGRVTPAQLMPGVVTNAAWAAQGGWGFLVNFGDGDANVEYTAPGLLSASESYTVGDDHPAIGGKFMTNAVRIINNDGDDWWEDA